MESKKNNKNNSKRSKAKVYLRVRPFVKYEKTNPKKF